MLNMGPSKNSCVVQTPAKPKKGEVQVRCECKSLDYSFRTNWRQCDHCG